MRDQSWTCDCGTKLMVRWPSHAHLITQTFTCPDCQKGREYWVGHPHEFYRLDETGNWQLV